MDRPIFVCSYVCIQGFYKYSRGTPSYLSYIDTESTFQDLVVSASFASLTAASLYSLS